MTDQDPLQHAVRHLQQLRLEHTAPVPGAFIVGAPRSGTTVLNQALCYVSDVGYVDNLIARFHWYPELGISIARELDYPKRWSGRSSFGSTDDVSEPHEFGQFWLDQLGLDSMEQTSRQPESLSRLQATLDRMSAVAGKAMLFKVFTLAWHLADFHVNHSPGSRWLYMRRDLASVARSILKMREARGPTHQWKAMMPQSALQYTDPYEQVVAQVIGIDQWLASELAKIPPTSWVQIEYSDFCGKFRSTIRQLTEFLGVGCDESRLEEAACGILPLQVQQSPAPGIDEARLQSVIRAFQG